MSNNRNHSHLSCKISTGICGRLTFGLGKLDEHGYWEHPCVECATQFQIDHPNSKVWPEPEKPSAAPSVAKKIIHAIIVRLVILVYIIGLITGLQLDF